MTSTVLLKLPKLLSKLSMLKLNRLGLLTMALLAVVTITSPANARRQNTTRIITHNVNRTPRFHQLQSYSSDYRRFKQLKRLVNNNVVRRTRYNSRARFSRMHTIDSRDIYFALNTFNSDYYRYRALDFLMPYSNRAIAFEHYNNRSMNRLFSSRYYGSRACDLVTNYYPASDRRGYNPRDVGPRYSENRYQNRHQNRHPADRRSRR